MYPIEEIFTHDQGNVTEKRFNGRKWPCSWKQIQMGVQALCDEAIAETSSCTFPFPASEPCPQDVLPSSVWNTC